jgi:hypothetical protein
MQKSRATGPPRRELTGAFSRQVQAAKWTRFKQPDRGGGGRSGGAAVTGMLSQIAGERVKIETSVRGVRA